MKICHITSAHKRYDTRIFQKECLSLAEAGFNTTLLVNDTLPNETKNGVKIISTHFKPQNRFHRMLNAQKGIFKIAKELNCSIYHLHDPELLPIGLKLKKIGKKVIFDSHEFYKGSILGKHYIVKPLRRLISTVYGEYERYVCSQLDALISVSPSLTSYLKGINPNTYQITNYPKLKSSATLSDFSKKQIVFAGGITQGWSHHKILKALENLPECRYALCGFYDSGEGYFERLKQLKGYKQTDYLGRISHEQVFKVLSVSLAGMALAVPSANTDGKNGTMGNTKIFEEMMAGLPVICTNFALWKEFVDRYQCGICVDPENEIEIEKAISYLLTHPEEARRMGRNGRRAVETEFNWSIEEQKLLSLYKSVSQN